MESDIVLNQSYILNSIENSTNNNIETTQQDLIDKNMNNLLRGNEQEQEEEKQKEEEEGSKKNRIEDTPMQIEEEKETKEKIKNEKISSVPAMMRCYICEDFCEEAVQIVCCNEIFCEKHIKEEIMKNFLCPNCKTGTNIKNVIKNSKLRENIQWYKTLLSEPLLPNGIINNNLLLNNTYANLDINTNVRPGGGYAGVNGSGSEMGISNLVNPSGVTVNKPNEINKENDNNEKEVVPVRNGENKGGDMRKIEDTKEMSPEEKMVLIDSLQKDDPNSTNPKAEEIKTNDGNTSTIAQVNPKGAIPSGVLPNQPTMNDQATSLPNQSMVMPNMPMIMNMPGMNTLAMQQMMYRMMCSQMQFDTQPTAPKSKSPNDKDKKKSSSSSSSDSSSSSSQSSSDSDDDSDDSRRKRHKKHSRSRSRSYSDDSHRRHRSSKRYKKSSRHDKDWKKRHSSKDIDKEKNKDRLKDRDKDRDKDKEKDRKKDKDKDKDKDKERKSEKDKNKEKEKDKDKSKDKGKSKDKEKEKKKDKDKEKSKDKDKDRDRNKDKDKHKEKAKDSKHYDSKSKTK